VNKVTIGIGADAYGYDLKAALIDHFGASTEFCDFGVDSSDDSLAYPAVAFRVAEAIKAGEFARAVLICGTGIGMAISANKVPGIRAAVAYDYYSVERSVLSNNCQVLALGARVIGVEVAKRIFEQWRQLSFDTSSNSAKKIEIIDRYEQVRSGGKPPREWTWPDAKPT
jgi:ribose 5-phosphate isomerase B